jgi:hypothetical protein
LLLEQDLATGRKGDGLPLRAKEARLRVGKCLIRDTFANPKLPDSSAASPIKTLVSREIADGPGAAGASVVDAERSDKLRLAALLAACHPTADGEMGALLKPAGLQLADHAASLRGLFFLGVPAKDQILPPPSAEASDRTVELARHVPTLQSVVADALSGDLPEDQFMEAVGSELEEGLTEALVSPRSALVGSWAFSKGGSASRPAPARVIVFVLGGASLSELQCATDQGPAGSVVFGTTALLTPQQYFSSLQPPPSHVARMPV